jgi:6-phosphogluconolactonase
VGAAPEVIVADSAPELAADVADRLLATLAAAQQDHDVASLVVSGGSILEQVFGALRDRAADASVDWSRVALWWGDERFVAFDSPDRNDAAAFRAGLGALAFDPGLVHRMPASDGPRGEDVEAGVADYIAALKADAPPGEEVPRFDVILLGVGPDGHCASLFPDQPGVHQLEPAVIAVYDSPKPPPTRTSFTFSSLTAAEEVWVIASGTGKADAVARALGGAPRIQVPSAGAQGRERTLWLIDKDAAVELPAS